MVFMKILTPFRYNYRLLHHKSFVLRIFLLYKTLHNNRDIFYDKTVLIFL